jgi:uncharacterized membrane protein YqaE (UPF0057 family)
VIISTVNGFWLKAFRIFTLLILPLSIWVFSGVASGEGVIAFLLCLLGVPFSAARFLLGGMDYVLYFVDDKNEIEYHLLKDFMKRNKLN